MPQPLLIGVSGGADSVALLQLLVELGYRPHICHLNHQWRGAASDADAEFVRALAGKLALPVTIESRLVAAGEAAAREARLAFFESVARQNGIRTLALAHTADDQAETILLRLLRGAGATGLVGIRGERQLGELVVLRPLLKITRAEVLAYLTARGLEYRTDSSNADLRFLRNRLRQELLPVLERDYNPALRETLARTAEILQEEDRYLDELARPHVAAALHIPTLIALPVALQRRVIRQWLDVEFDHIEAIRALPAEIHLPSGITVYREYDWLRTGVRSQESRFSRQWPVNLENETAIAELALRLQVVQAGGEMFDAVALGSAPFVRTWRAGDAFQPLGMAHQKKLQDFFVDEKIPRRDRDTIPLLCAADGRIAWIIGHRIADPFKVTEQTARVVRIRADKLVAD